MNIPLRKVGAAHLRSYPLIGARWKPGTVERRDTETGTYEMLNSMCETRTEYLVQHALLKKGKK